MQGYVIYILTWVSSVAALFFVFLFWYAYNHLCWRSPTPGADFFAGGNAASSGDAKRNIVGAARLEKDDSEKDD